MSRTASAFPRLTLRTGVAMAALTTLVVAVPATSGASSGARHRAASCNSPGVTSSEIKAGVLYPKSGPEFGSQFLPFGAGVRARFGVENAKGGVGGRKLVATEADDQGDNTVNLASAKQLVQDQGVFGVIEASPASKGPSGQYLNQQGVPVTGWPINFVWGKYKNMFGYGGSTSPDPSALQGGKTTTTVAQFLKDHGATNLASIGINVTESAAAATNLAGAFRAIGAKVGYLRTDLPSQPVDYTADAQAMKSAHVDTLGGSIQQPNFTDLYQAAKQAGINFKVAYSPTGYDQRIVDAFGKQLAGTYFVIDFAPFELELPATKAFDQAMATYAPDSKPARQQLSMIGWLSADLFIRGLQAAGTGCPTRAAFVSNLRKVKDYNAGGLLLVPVNEQTAFGTLSLCTNFVQISADGTHFQLVTGNPAKPGYQSTCGKLIKAKS